MSLRIPLDEAFSPRPLGSIRLGEETHSIPPLTFGRWMRLLACDLAALQTALLAPPREGQSLPTLPPVESFAPLAAAVIPTVTEAAWREHATIVTWADAYLALYNGHDWAWIADACGIDEAAGGPEAAREKAGAQEVMVSHLAFCGLVPGYTPERLLDTRLEGYFMLMESASDLAGRRSEAYDGAPVHGVSAHVSDVAESLEAEALPGSMGRVKDPERAARLADLMRAADERSQVAPDGD